MKKILCILAVMIVTISMLPLAVAAEDTLQLNKEGSITLELYYDGKPIKDGSFVCIQVADIVERDGKYYFRQLMEKEIYEELPTAAEMYQLVMDNKNFFRTDNYAIIHSNTTGTVTFGGRKPGLYLIIQDEKFKDYSKMNPFLVTLPYQEEDGTYCYEVDATVKSELKKDYTSPTSPASPTKPSGGKLPQTGQLNWPIPWMASIGMMLFALGWWLFFGSRKDAYET